MRNNPEDNNIIDILYDEDADNPSLFRNIYGDDNFNIVVNKSNNSDSNSVHFGDTKKLYFKTENNMQNSVNDSVNEDQMKNNINFPNINNSNENINNQGAGYIFKARDEGIKNIKIQNDNINNKIGNEKDIIHNINNGGVLLGNNDIINIPYENINKYPNIIVPGNINNPDVYNKNEINNNEYFPIKMNEQYNSKYILYNKNILYYS